MADPSYFVRIPDYQLIKLALLESAKESLLLSKAYHELLVVRKKKSSLISSLKSQAAEVMSLFKELHEVLPHADSLLKEPTSKSHHRTVPVSKNSSLSLSSPEDATLNQINSELSSIEKQLKDFS
ncbi:MAG: hypothetical protein ACQESC_01005 [Nanobdellota archaeon]